MRQNSSRLKYLSLALIVCSLVLVMTGMGAFTTATSERQLSVNVAEESAFLEIEATDPTISQTGVDYAVGKIPAVGQDKIIGNTSNDTQVILGMLTNHFSSPLTSFDITVSEEGSGDITVRNPTITDRTIPSKHSSQLTATVECGTMTGTTETMNISIKATGSSTSISTAQPVEITCAGGLSQTGATNTTTQPLQP